MGSRAARAVARRFAGAVAALGLAATTTVALGAAVVVATATPSGAAELVRTATVTGGHIIPEPPADPDGTFSVLPWIPLSIPFEGVPINAQAVDVEITIEITHPSQSEIDLYLARPGGQGQMVRLMSDIGGALTGVRFTFDDHAALPVPGGPADGGRYRPNDLGDDDLDLEELRQHDDTFSLDFLRSSDPGHGHLWGATNPHNASGEWRIFALDDTRNGVTGVITYAEIRVTYGVTNDRGPEDPYIAIPTLGDATPFPSVVRFEDLGPGFYDNIPEGTVRGIVVHLDGVLHDSPDDLAIAIRGPNGKVAVLLAAVDLSMTTTPTDVRFVHGAPSIAPGQPLPFGTFGPSLGPGAADVPLDTLFPGSGLTGPQTGGLEQFAGIDPAGDWELFVRDRVPDHGGSIERWAIALDLNEPPVAVDDSYTVDEDAVLVRAVASDGVLGNDTDPEGDPLTAELVTGPSHGMLALGPDGSFTYTPNGDFHGTDSFTYRASDGDLSSVATVTITVDPVNDAPVADTDNYTLDEDTTLVVDAPGVLANDGDVDGDELTAALSVAPGHGTLDLDPDGGFTYTPHPDFHGTDFFSYDVSDGEVFDHAAVFLTVQPVNDPPTAADDAYATGEDTPLVVAVEDGVLDNDLDVDGDALQAVLVDGAAHGSLSLAPDGSFTYTPHDDYVGPDSFTYVANDGSLDSSPATVTILVGPNVQDAPIAVDDLYDGTEDEVLVVPVDDGLLANDVDVDVDDVLTAAVESPPATGTLDLAPDGSFTYTPAPDADGLVTFTYRVSDGIDSDVATVTIDLAPVPDDPVANPDELEVDEDGTLDLGAAEGVLANDVDADGDVLYALVAEEPEHGTLELDLDGGLRYEPDPDFHGTDSFAYVVSDVEPGEEVEAAATSEPAVVTITVRAVNDPPVAVDDEADVAAGEAVTVDVLANDSDVDGDPLTVRLLTAPVRGTATCSATDCTYEAAADDPGGEVTFAYEVDDGAGGTAAATVVVTVEAAEPTPAPAPQPAPDPAPGGGVLPRTGGDPEPLSRLGALLLAAGAVATMAGTAAGRRRARPAHARRR